MAEIITKPVVESYKQGKRVYEPPGQRFRIYYSPCIPDRGPSNAHDGVADFELIEVYARALQHAYEQIGPVGRRWTEPPLRDDERIDVIVHYRKSPGTFRPYPQSEQRQPNDLPTIFLRNEIVSAWTPQARLDQAAIEATHEVAHIFTGYHLNPRRMILAPGGDRERLDRPWLWFDEATASYFEFILNEGNPGTLSYYRALCWVKWPEAALELCERSNPEGYVPRLEELTYPAAWLVMHLERKHPGLLKRVWHRSRKTDTPRDALRNFLRDEGSSLEDFLHDYAVWSQKTCRLDRTASERYGDRMIAYVHPLNSPRSPRHEWDCSIHPLGCRYYRIGPADPTALVRVEVHPRTSEPLRHLRATLHFLDHPEDQMPDLIPLNNMDGCLVSEPQTLGADAHLILVISSCEECPIGNEGYYDATCQEYRVVVEVA